MIKQLIIISTAIFTFSGTACSQKNNSENTDKSAHLATKVELLKPTDFSQSLKANPGVIIDVRTPQETKKGIIEGAKLLNLFDDNFEQEIDKLDKNTTYYVYCAAGGRSGETVELMEKKGFKHVVDLDGGYSKWQSEGLPTVMPTN